MFVCFQYKSVSCLFLYVLIALRDSLTEIRLSLNVLRYIKLADCMLIHKLDGCCNTTVTPFTPSRIAWQALGLFRRVVVSHCFVLP